MYSKQVKIEIIKFGNICNLWATSNLPTFFINKNESLEYTRITS